MKPIIISISGKSGVGKTTISNVMSHCIGISKCLVLSTDDLHKYDRHDPSWKEITHFNPIANNIELGDFHICGVLTNEAIKTYKDNPISSLKERKTIISSLRCVDMVLTQNSQSPLENLKEIKESFPHIKELIIIEGSNWNSIPDEDKIKKLGIKIVKHEYYEKLSDEKISKKIKKNGK